MSSTSEEDAGPFLPKSKKGKGRAQYYSHQWEWQIKHDPDMRLSQIYYTSPTRHHARRPQRVDSVPFQMLLPLKLKKTVSGKSDRTKEAPCMQEMALMFACFKKSEFDQQECLKEITSFQTCYNAAKERSSTLREQERKGVLVPGEKRLTHRQMNQLMKTFPPQN